MAILLQAFQGSEQVLRPGGGSIRFSFEASTTGLPSRFRARVWIADEEPYTFSPAGGDPRSLFIPGEQELGRLTKGAFAEFKLPTSIVGPEDDQRTQPLQVNLEVQGYRANGQPSGPVLNDRWLITIATLSMTLGVVKTHFNLTHAQLAPKLGVKPATTQKVIAGGTSPAVSEALAKILGG